ncbi:ArsR family transcriptional regulator [Natranaerovirga pectinivora]|uniref:ArsR family transcriptional regulator n=1 Tax=Natranaerovirga pectinivora TaxID=682400 RepID=A0A4R3MG25_9FIRM|nr:ArsR family transcriptional regulator [Natranaerovirga pectinivora]
MLVNILKAVGDGNRLRILHLLMEKELCVCELESLLDITQSNASRHLNKLKSAGIIESFKSAQWVYYRISDTFIEEHKELYDYLRSQFTMDKDIELLHRYLSSEFDCTFLRDDKEKVLKVLTEQCVK